MMSLPMSETSFGYIHERSSVVCVMRIPSSATLEFTEDTLIMLSFHFSFMRKPTLVVVSCGWGLGTLA